MVVPSPPTRVGGSIGSSVGRMCTVGRSDGVFPCVLDTLSLLVTSWTENAQTLTHILLSRVSTIFSFSMHDS